jgi:hypothetical protein
MGAAAAAAVQPDDTFRPRGAQRRGDAPSGNGRAIDDFALMMLIVMLSIPLLLLVRRSCAGLLAERAG